MTVYYLATLSKLVIDDGKIEQESKNIANIMNEHFADAGIKMANSIPILKQEVKRPRNNTSHSAQVKSLFLTPYSDDEIFSLIPLLDYKKVTKKNDVDTKFTKHGKTVIALILC